MTVVLPASQGSALPPEYSELLAAAGSPALYRLFAAFDMAVWLGLGGLVVTLAAIFARIAPIRSALIRACGIGQVIGIFGAVVRLFGTTDLAARYASAVPDQQAAFVGPNLAKTLLANPMQASPDGQRPTFVALSDVPHATTPLAVRC